MIASISLAAAILGQSCSECAGGKNDLHATVEAPAPRPLQTTLKGSAVESFRKIVEGNARFAEGLSQNKNQGSERRREVATGQSPHTIFLSCADSRVPPEVIFDQGLGDIFIVRVAGNIIDTNSIASIEYAAAVLGSPLLVVLGHERCGAVDAAVKADKDPSGLGTNKEMANIEALVAQIMPSVKAVKGAQGNLLDNAILKNVEMTKMNVITKSPMLDRMVKEGKFSVVGGVYDLDTGRVTFTETN
ncbi:MAG: carbonic anhydrase [Fimbriimonadaceae bacterium]